MQYSTITKKVFLRKLGEESKDLEELVKKIKAEKDS